MPKNTKTSTETHPSIPMPARVQEDEEFRPIAVSLEGKTLGVASIDDRVEDEGEWWEPEPVFKMHCQLTLEDGRQVAVFRNMKTGSQETGALENLSPEALEAVGVGR